MNKIGQLEVLRFIEKMTVPVSARQISVGIDDCFQKVCKNIRSLLKSKEIKMIEIDRNLARQYLKNQRIDRRLSLYYGVHLDFLVDELVDLG